MQRPKLPESEGFGLSPEIWGNFPYESIFSKADRNIGYGFFDDFTDFGGALSTNDGQYWSEGNRYLSYQTASTFIVPVADSSAATTTAAIHHGAIKFSPTSGVADNDIMTLQLGGQLATPYGAFPYNVCPSVLLSRDLAFECRMKLSDSSASIGDFFIGLAGAAGVQLMTAVLPIADADTLGTTFSMLGFSKLGADADLAYLTYERASGTVARTRQAATLVDDTYIKLGFRWYAADKQLRVYADNTEVSACFLTSAVTGTAGTGTTPWPNDYMTPICCCKQIDGTTAQVLTLDWWACSQLL